MALRPDDMNCKTLTYQENLRVRFIYKKMFSIAIFLS